MQITNALRKQMKHMSKPEPQEISESENHFSAMVPKITDLKSVCALHPFIFGGQCSKCIVKCDQSHNLDEPFQLYEHICKSNVLPAPQRGSD